MVKHKIKILFTIFYFCYVACFDDCSKDKVSQFVLHGKKGSDPFEILTEECLQKEWSHDSKQMLMEKVQSLSHMFEDQLSVQIVLISNKQNNLLEQQLKNTLKNYVYTQPVTCVKSEDEHANYHQLQIEQKFYVEFIKSEINLINKMINTINSTLQYTSEINSNLIESILKTHYNDNSNLYYTFYVIDLELNSSPIKYSYDYIFENSICHSSFGMGSDRYIWLDLQSQTPNFGPKTVGDGLITSRQIPSIFNYVKESQFTNEQKNEQLTIDLLSFTTQSLQLLFGSTIYNTHFPAAVNKDITLHFITIYDSNEYHPLDIMSIQDEIKIVTQMQNIKYKETNLSVRSNAYLLSLYNQVIKSYTSTIASGELIGQTRQYIDSLELRYWLLKLKEVLIDSNEIEGDDTSIIPIYILDFYNEVSYPYLLDRFHQSISFSDSVVALRSQISQYYVDFSCGTSTMVISPNNPNKSIIKSILQTVWGITPVHQTWSIPHNKIIENYMWSLNDSPFSNNLEINTFERDKAIRNVLYSKVHITLTQVNDLFTHFSEYEKEVSEVLTPSEHLQFIRRWNLFEFKLEQAKKYLSTHDPSSCYYFISSLQYDVDSLHGILHSAGKNFFSFLHCDTEENQNNNFKTDIFYYLILSSPIILLLYMLFILYTRIINK